MFNRLGEIIKKIEGNVLVIGLDDALLDKFNSNNKVNLYSIYSPKKTVISFSSSKKRKTNHGKTINIKKLRKYINKKAVNHLIINIDEILKYYKYVIKDTIYLSNNLIYLYSTNNTDKDFIIEKYKRYDVKIDVTEYKNGYLIIVYAKNSKSNFFKDKLYVIKDTFYNIAEAIGNILVG